MWEDFATFSIDFRFPTTHECEDLARGQAMGS